MQIQISWLLQKPTDLDLHCLHRQGISGFSRTRVNSQCMFIAGAAGISMCIVHWWTCALSGHWVDWAVKPQHKQTRPRSFCTFHLQKPWILGSAQLRHMLCLVLIFPWRITRYIFSCCVPMCVCMYKCLYVCACVCVLFYLSETM